NFNLSLILRFLAQTNIVQVGDGNSADSLLDVSHVQAAVDLVAEVLSPDDSLPKPQSICASYVLRTMTRSRLFYLLLLLTVLNTPNNSELIENNVRHNLTQAHSDIKKQIVNTDTVILGDDNEKSQLILLSPQIMALINLLNLGQKFVNETDLPTAVSAKQENFDRLFVNGSNNQLFELLKITPQVLIDLGILESQQQQQVQDEFETRQLSNGSILILGDNNTLTRGIVVDPQAAVKLRLSALLQQVTDLLGPDSLTAGDCVLNDSSPLIQEKNTEIVQIGNNNKLNTLTEVGGQVLVDGSVAVDLFQQLRCILKNPENLTTARALNFTTPVTLTPERLSIKPSTKPLTEENSTSKIASSASTSTQQPSRPATDSSINPLTPKSSTPSMKRPLETTTLSPSKPLRTPTTTKPSIDSKPQINTLEKTHSSSVTSHETFNNSVPLISATPANERPYILPLPLLLAIHIHKEYVDSTVPLSSQRSTSTTPANEIPVSISTPLPFANQSTPSSSAQRRCYRRNCLKWKKKHLLRVGSRRSPTVPDHGIFNKNTFAVSKSDFFQNECSMQ
uniref:Uncharacterized protein n=1 Tax=Glossina pallidipes TaxID=7398 RepID=A0A1B0A025_GLOPL